jgi:hypothetical protein
MGQVLLESGQDLFGMALIGRTDSATHYLGWTIRVRLGDGALEIRRLFRPAIKVLLESGPEFVDCALAMFAPSTALVGPGIVWYSESLDGCEEECNEKHDNNFAKRHDLFVLLNSDPPILC